ncbi:MAG: restriction endonuclease subunit S [Cyanobacteria bacterium SBLK]|nr:restriction endonuclease subunit S [Cyanobacteria bacterium SBLK]
MSEWQQFRLNELCKITSSKRIFSREYVDSGIPFYRSKEIIEKALGNPITECLFISEKRFREIHKKFGSPKEGDILISSVGVRTGIPYLVKKKDDEFYFKDGNLIWIKCLSELLNSSFFLYWLKSNLGQESLESVMIGSAQPALTIVGVSELYLKIPDIQEQKEIAAILSCLDAKIENLRKQNETLERIAQTLFKHWFIDFEFPNEKDEPYRSSGGAMQSSALGEIPVGWHVGKVGEEVETLGGGTPLTKEISYWENGDIAWYSPTDLTKAKTLFSIDSEKKITELGLKNSSAKLFPKYSLLMTSRATIGEIAINTRKASTNQGCITIVPSRKFSIYYLHGWLLTKIRKIKVLASGSTFPEISKSIFINLEFIVPNPDILVRHKQAIEPIYKKVENNIFQIQTLTKTRDTLLPKLMSGNFRPSPNLSPGEEDRSGAERRELPIATGKPRQ